MRFRTPRIRISPGGIKITNIGARIGSRWAGLNIGRRGVSSSVSGKGWSYNSRRGCSLNPFACCSVIALMPGIIFVGAMLLWFFG